MAARASATIYNVLDVNEDEDEFPRAARASAIDENIIYDEKDENVHPLDEFPMTPDDDFSVFLLLDIPRPENEAYRRAMAAKTSRMTRNELRSHRKERKKMKTQRKKGLAERIKMFQDLYDKGDPTILSNRYKEMVEAGLVRFFRAGYEKYWNKGVPAEDAVVLAEIRRLVTKYNLLISGGFILKNLGLSEEGLSDPSVDIDIFIPSNTPVKHPEFYETMAKLFNADRKRTKKGREDWVVNRFMTERSHGRGLNHFRSRNIFSVYSFERDVGKGEDVYAKMDLVRPYEGTSSSKLIRNFDMSICMNWYDGHHLYAMDPPAIFKRAPGHFNVKYNHLLFSDPSAPHYTRYRNRVVKYMLRGYRLRYMDTSTGEFVEIRPSDFPNAIDRLDKPQRIKYYKMRPNERPVNFDVKGIHLSSNMLVEKLSGPTSYSYLKPPTALYEAYRAKGFDLPLIMLFGDHHQSLLDMCSPCEKKKGCLSIASREFLRAMDTLASNTPVDFYTESSLSMGNSWSMTGAGVLFDLLIDQAVKFCHRVPKRTMDEYTIKCPTSRMRWQYADARFMMNYIESIPVSVNFFIRYVFEPSLMGKKIKPFPTYLQRYYPYLDESKREEWSDTYQRVSLTYFDAIYDFEVPTYPKPTAQHIRQIISEMDKIPLIDDALYRSTKIENLDPNHLSSFETLLQAKAPQLLPYSALLSRYVQTFYRGRQGNDQALYDSIVNTVIHIGEHVLRKVNRLFTIITSATSVLPSGILKQLRKIPISEFQSVDYWKDQYVKSIFDNIRYMTGMVRVFLYHVYEPTFATDIASLREMISSPSPRITLKPTSLNRFLLHYYGTYLAAPLLDIYTLTRMFKEPVDGVSPTMIFGFFGEMHSLNIIRFLTEIGYEVRSEKFQKPNAPPSELRCITIDEYIPLMDDVAEHHALRFNGQNARKNRYTAKIRNEARQRNQSMARLRNEARQRSSVIQREPNDSDRLIQKWIDARKAMYQNFINRNENQALNELARMDTNLFQGGRRKTYFS
jgi:hypothetical protein